MTPSKGLVMICIKLRTLRTLPEGAAHSKNSEEERERLIHPQDHHYGEGFEYQDELTFLLPLSLYPLP